MTFQAIITPWVSRALRAIHLYNLLIVGMFGLG
jgi:hypothetical protein